MGLRWKERRELFRKVNDSRGTHCVPLLMVQEIIPSSKGVGRHCMGVHASLGKGGYFGIVLVFRVYMRGLRPSVRNWERREGIEDVNCFWEIFTRYRIALCWAVDLHDLM